MPDERIRRQIDFLAEIDKLKTVFRKSYLIADPQRRENSAEHSWHISVMALVLQEYCPSEIDLLRVLKMLLVHDIVEVDAGDSGIYDQKAALDKAERENRAAERLFGLLPVDQKIELTELWNEFEEKETSEAKFAGALDRLEPLIHNYYTQGKRWKEDGITYDQVYSVNRKIGESSPALWEYAQFLINDSVEKGYLRKR
jgi:putative hydrolase of HD superfamily